MENKLAKLRGGVTLVRPEERKAVQDMYSEKLSQWRRRKRMFKDIWDTLTENSPKDPKEFKVFYLACIVIHIKFLHICYITSTYFPLVQEELGIEYDEDVGVSLQSFSDLLQHGKKRQRGQ